MTRLAGRARASRRAFALAMVLVLIMMLSVIVGGVLQRFAAQQRTVQRQVAEYHMHHDMFGVQAMALQWLSRARAADLIRVADTGETAFGFALPAGKQVEVFIEDGQDTALASAEALEPRDVPFYRAMLARLPEDRPDLLRGAGPAAISLNQAPEELIRALFGPDLTRAADAIIRARGRDRIDRAVVADALTDAGASVEAQQSLVTLVSVDPSLWRLRIQTDDGFEPREFEMLVEITAGRPMMLAWRERFAGAEEEGRTADEPRRRRRR